MLDDEEVIQRLSHALSLKTERGLRNSIIVLKEKLERDLDETNIYKARAMIESYQTSSFAYLRNLVDMNGKLG
jgi:hypothetical protein